ncbi:hypothetical protein MNBD_CHLOROFLEXI01-3624, partial [hydrothermal vent metagenome]
AGVRVPIYLWPLNPLASESLIFFGGADPKGFKNP